MAYTGLVKPSTQVWQPSNSLASGCQVFYSPLQTTDVSEIIDYSPAGNDGLAEFPGSSPVGTTYPFRLNVAGFGQGVDLNTGFRPHIDFGTPVPFSGTSSSVAVAGQLLRYDGIIVNDSLRGISATEAELRIGNFSRQVSVSILLNTPFLIFYGCDSGTCFVRCDGVTNTITATGITIDINELGRALGSNGGFYMAGFSAWDRPLTAAEMTRMETDFFELVRPVSGGNDYTRQRRQTQQFIG